MSKVLAQPLESVFFGVCYRVYFGLYQNTVYPVIGRIFPLPEQIGDCLYFRTIYHYPERVLFTLSIISEDPRRWDEEAM